MVEGITFYALYKSKVLIIMKQMTFIDLWGYQMKFNFQVHSHIRNSHTNVAISIYSICPEFLQF